MEPAYSGSKYRALISSKKYAKVRRPVAPKQINIQVMDDDLNFGTAMTPSR